MSDETPTAEPVGPRPQADQAEQAGIREYQVLCIFALGVIFLIDLQEGSTLLSMLLLLIGLLGILTRLRLGPVLFLLGFAVIEWLKRHGGGRLGGLPPAALRDGRPAQDVALSMATLAYTLGQYRLQSLLAYILPPDPRRRSGGRRWLVLSPRIVLQRRSGALVSPPEVAWFVLGLPVWALIAHGLWALLAPPRPLFDLPVGLARVIYFGWALGLGMLVTASALDLWQRWRSPPDIAALYLQDVLWRETRGEQRRVNRWTAWWRIKKKP
jgi:hypothetical protein